MRSLRPRIAHLIAEAARSCVVVGPALSQGEHKRLEKIKKAKIQECRENQVNLHAEEQRRVALMRTLEVRKATLHEADGAIAGIEQEIEEERLRCPRPARKSPRPPRANCSRSNWRLRIQLQILIRNETSLWHLNGYNLVC